MHTVYVAVDDSAYSLGGIALAERLNRQLKGHLVLASIVSPDDEPEVQREALEMELADAGYARYQDSLHVEQGDDAAEALAGLVAERDDALLCMTSHGRRPVTELFLGSVAAETVRLSGKLVVLHGPRFDPDARRRIDTLMVCVDGSALAEAVLPQAVALADGLGARIQLLHVLEVDSLAASALPGGVGHGDIMESGYVQSLAHRIHAEYRAEVDWEVLHGKEPASSVVSYLANQPDVMVVMTTHGRSGLSQLAAGSVSREVLHQARCPVAVMRPVEAG
ncbi:universal stress protein [Halomonas sp. C05BenzN]|uniref:universal stress protein n=1 Tax=Halomonas sp. C05BenzN TaxID=3411041 RepID=UPI003B934E94